MQHNTKLMYLHNRGKTNHTSIFLCINVRRRAV